MEEIIWEPVNCVIRINVWAHDGRACGEFLTPLPFTPHAGLWITGLTKDNEREEITDCNYDLGSRRFFIDLEDDFAAPDEGLDYCLRLYDRGWSWTVHRGLRHDNASGVRPGRGSYLELPAAVRGLMASEQNSWPVVVERLRREQRDETLFWVPAVDLAAPRFLDIALYLFARAAGLDDTIALGFTIGQSIAIRDELVASVEAEHEG